MSRRSATITLVNHQRRDAVPLRWLERLARCAVRRLRIAASGRFVIAFVDDRTMRALSRRFTGRRHLTDVLSFRYQGEPVIGEILIAPAAARHYAAAHRVPYRQELARYVLHGLLHWRGEEDRTPRQQQRMRAIEDRLLTACQ